MSSRLFAWWLLGRRMALQLGAASLRPLRRPRGAPAFLAAVGPEGYLPLTRTERADLPAFTRCICCGLCSLACPAVRDAPASAWVEAWTFVAGPSRMLERSPLAATALEPCALCDACAAVCPTGVPIPRLAGMVRRLSQTSEDAR